MVLTMTKFDGVVKVARRLFCGFTIRSAILYSLSTTPNVAWLVVDSPEWSILEAAVLAGTTVETVVVYKAPWRENPTDIKALQGKSLAYWFVVSVSKVKFLKIKELRPDMFSLKKRLHANLQTKQKRERKE